MGPLPRRGLAKWVRCCRHQKFLGFFLHFLPTKCLGFGKSGFCQTPPGDVKVGGCFFLKVSDWFFESGKWLTPPGGLKTSYAPNPALLIIYSYLKFKVRQTRNSPQFKLDDSQVDSDEYLGLDMGRFEFWLHGVSGCKRPFWSFFDPLAHNSSRAWTGW